MYTKYPGIEQMACKNKVSWKNGNMCTDGMLIKKYPGNEQMDWRCILEMNRLHVNTKYPGN